MSTVVNSAESGVTHRREVPKAWPQLIAPIIAAPDSVEAVTEVWHRVGELDVDELDSNRYFAIGSALCHYARAMRPTLTDPVRRQELVENGAEAIVKRSFFTEPTIAIEKILEPKMEAALAGRQAPERIMGDILEVRSYIRRPDRPPLTMQECFDEHILRSLHGDESFLADRLKTIALGAVSILDVIVYEAQKARDGRASLRCLAAEDDIAMLRTPHTMMWLKRLAARVPLVHIQDVAKRSILFDTDSNGNQMLRDIDWQAERVRMAEQGMQWPTGTKRTTKLVCPAMHVTGMIDDSVGLTVDMLDKAREIQTT